jgi:UDP-N-acetylglucosamine 2-epimerase (non-hydrolysing)
MPKIKIMPIFGTRPEAIKMAPVIKTLEQDAFFQIVTVVTAQHREMLDQVLNLFNLKPDYDLNIMSASQSITDIISRVLYGMKDIFAREKPDMVLVHGDTSTTFASSLAAFLQQIPVGHVEAGLRTNNKYSPYPEEMNRKLTGSLTDLHFAPTKTAKEALLREGVDSPKIVVTGNTVIDALLQTVQNAYCYHETILNQIKFKERKILLLTTHRRENLGEPMRQIFHAVKEIVETNPSVEVIFPVHKNPQVRNPANEILGGVERIHFLEPLDYEPFSNLIKQSYMVLTDSGGIQEEAPALGKPVLVLRDTTERPEAVAAGTVKLVGTQRQTIIKETRLLLNNRDIYEQMSCAVNPYGDGRAAERIHQALLNHCGLSDQKVNEWVH